MANELFGPSDCPFVAPELEYIESSNNPCVHMLRRQGELSVAERYLTRATSLSGGRDHAAKGGERGGKTAGVGAAEDWLTLMKFYAERTPSSARATDTLVRRRQYNNPDVAC